jgi:hypothetical protein
MKKKATNPFTYNPLSRMDEPVLLKVPDAPETHEPRKPLRTYLAARGGGGDLSELLSAISGRKPKMVVERVKDTEPPDEEDEFVAPPAPRGR